MVWPPQSPDLNIMESVWDLHEETEAAETPKSTEELWQLLQDTGTTDLPSTKKHCAGVPRRKLLTANIDFI